MPPLISRLLRGMTHTFCPLTATQPHVLRGDRCGNILINIREKDEHRERQCPQIVPRVSGHYRVKTWESHSGAPARNQAPGSERNRSIEHSGDHVLNTARDTEWNIHQDQIGAEREIEEE